MVDLYDRQREIGLTIPPSLTVVGVGGIGSWVAILAAMSGVKNIYLFDPDVMEEHNRNRLPFCEGSIGRPKVEVVREYIMSIRPDAIVVAIPEKLGGILLDIQMGVSSFIIDCTDSPRAQFEIYNKCKEYKVDHLSPVYIRAGYDGTNITVTGAVSGWIKTDVEEEDYTVNPSWVVPAVTVAALAVGRMEKYFDQEVACDISEIGIAVLQRTKRITARCRQDEGTPRPTRRRTTGRPRTTVEGEIIRRFGIRNPPNTARCILCGERHGGHYGVAGEVCPRDH